jgi:general secretion pathway protein E
MQSQHQDEQQFARDFGALLVERGQVSATDVERAARLQSETGERLDVILTKLGLIAERELAEALGAYLDIPVVGPADYPVEPVLAERIGGKFIKEHRIIPLADTPEGVVVVMANPLDPYIGQAIQLVADKPALTRIGVPAEIEAAYERLYGSERGAIGDIFDDAARGGEEGTEDDIARLADLASEAPVIRLVNMLISRAVEMRASDIHIEPFERLLKVRYRVDGVLRDVESPPQQLRAAVTSRIKIMAKLNIAERRLPQDGRIRLAIRGKEIDLRVSTVPTMHGESVVMRVLDAGAEALDFPSLGFGQKALKTYIKLLDEPIGILMVTGPTGSGKTTTLYTSLKRFNTGDRKVVTVEDPVEYQIEGINQMQVKPQIGLTFANALRSILRHDPDVIMVGEIRDLDTAQIAVQAALTGHKVLSTLHTNDAASTITRLLDMKVDGYLVASTLNGVVAQRLVRTLCTKCREPRQAIPEALRELGLDPSKIGDVRLHQAKGCPACDGTGYRGRTGIHETLVMTDALRAEILRRAEARRIQQVAVSEGMRTMYRDGLDKALAGVTTVEEVLRVTREA